MPSSPPASTRAVVGASFGASGRRRAASSPESSAAANMRRLRRRFFRAASRAASPGRAPARPRPGAPPGARRRPTTCATPPPPPDGRGREAPDMVRHDAARALAFFSICSCADDVWRHVVLAQAYRVCVGHRHQRDVARQLAHRAGETADERRGAPIRAARAPRSSACPASGPVLRRRQSRRARRTWFSPSPFGCGSTVMLTRRLLRPRSFAGASSSNSSMRIPFATAPAPARAPPLKLSSSDMVARSPVRGGSMGSVRAAVLIAVMSGIAARDDLFCDRLATAQVEGDCSTVGVLSHPIDAPLHHARGFCDTARRCWRRCAAAARPSRIALQHAASRSLSTASAQMTVRDALNSGSCARRCSATRTSS